LGGGGVINGTDPSLSYKVIPLDRQKNTNNHVTSLNFPELKTSQRLLMLIGLLYRLANSVETKFFIAGPVSSQASSLDMQSVRTCRQQPTEVTKNGRTVWLSPVTCLVYTLSLSRRQHRRNWFQAVGFTQLEYICMKLIETNFFQCGRHLHLQRSCRPEQDGLYRMCVCVPSLMIIKCIVENMYHQAKAVRKQVFSSSTMLNA
jgi:hypothetical protein